MELIVSLKNSAILKPSQGNLTEALTTSEIQQQILDDEAVLLVYSLGRDRSFLWLVISTEVKSYQLPKREEIEQLSQSFLAEIGSKVVVPPLGEELSQVLLFPVINQLGNKRLVVVGDGILQTVPFAALPISHPINSLFPKSHAPKPPIMGALIDEEIGKMGDFEQLNSSQISQVKGDLEKISSPQNWGARGATQPISKASHPLNPPIMGYFEKINSSQISQVKENFKTISSPQNWGARGAKLISMEGEGGQNRGYTPLIVQHEMITLPSGSSLAILREQVQGRTPGPKKVAVIADPVFEENDIRFQGDDQAQTETRTNMVRDLEKLAEFIRFNQSRI